jgi:hypothetical protein
VGLILFLASFVGFGVLVEVRSAFLSRRMGDLGVYLRAAWTIRTDPSQLYTIADDNDWHYNYPPLFAILLTPLADPPPGATKPGMMPYAASVAICYLLNLLCLALGVHVLASALEESSAHAEVRQQAAFCRRWWYLRALPVFICLPPIDHTLMRGQANLVLLALVCAMTAALLRGQRLRAGLWLAGAICLKIFPLYLLLVPMWRRDGRCLAGCGLGLVLGLAVIPGVVLGPTRTVECYKELGEALVGPALHFNKHEVRAKELLEVTATDSQSFLATIHNTLNLDRATRPNEASEGVRRAHWLLGGLFTLLTLAAVWRHDRGFRGKGLVLFVGALTILMILLSPVCHTHYFALAVPLTMGLLAWAWEQDLQPAQRGRLALFFAGQIIGQLLPLVPSLEVLKDTGLAMYTALLLWLVGCLVLRRWPGQKAKAEVGSPIPRAA